MSKRALVLLFLVATSLHAQTIKVTIDATDAPRKIFHSHLTIPITEGPQRLAYPKWIPGEHGPTGPIADLVNVRITANGQPVPWRRDPRDMFIFHIDVPRGATALEADLSYLAPNASGNFTSGPSSTANLAVVSWNTLLLYPLGRSADDIMVEGTIRLPEGWKSAGALQPGQRASLATYVDSPVIMGRYLRQLDLPSGTAPKHRMSIVADSRSALDTPETFAADYARLIEEAGAAFGAYHFSKYDWLVTLSDDVAHFGLEHHESSDNRMPEETLETPEMRRALGGLLSHEYVHSWNGKYRRPAIQLSADFQQPMEGTLLWVYEGLTQYLGGVLATRSGLWTPEYFRENLALVAGRFDIQPGRTWRPLGDTATAAQILFGSASAWESLRRSVDFYDESILLWLEADSIIRQKTNGRATLDDFTRRFHGGNTGRPELKPYTYDEVIATLNAIAPHDWRKHFDERLSSLDPRAPIAGITNHGWKLVFNDTPNEAIAAGEKRSKTQNLIYSLGMSVGEDGTVSDAFLGQPAANAGIGPGMKITAVNGRRYSRAVMEKALREKGALELLVENNGHFRTHNVEYRGGVRYPHLVRDEGKTDTLQNVLGSFGGRGTRSAG
ncbi:MAG TPA: M61 family peptidase [Thermoanaerobaculia bacterium]|nr:M61 family peptidase [Thermoanaerobaculia bacterium]